MLVEKAEQKKGVEYLKNLADVSRGTIKPNSNKDLINRFLMKQEP